jgi:hypothetical protein
MPGDAQPTLARKPRLRASFSSPGKRQTHVRRVGEGTRPYVSYEDSTGA